MGYIDNNLTPGEEIKCLAKLHWIMFFGPAVFFVFAFLVVGSGGKETASALPAFLVIGVIYAGLRYLNFWTSEFGLTNKKLVAKTGFIKRRTLEMVLPKIETIAVKQGILGKMLNYGTIIVVGSGGTRKPFKRIAAPLDFRKSVLNEIGKLGK